MWGPCELAFRFMSSDTQNENGDSSSKKSSGGDYEGPVCPRCKEPFTDTLSAITTTRFIRCQNCNHFFIFLAESDHNILHSQQFASEEAMQHEDDLQPKSLPSPREMFKHLNEYVIGQEKAKKVLSVAMYNHYKRLNSCLPSSQQQGENGGYVEQINLQPPIGTPGYDRNLITSRLQLLPRGLVHTSNATQSKPTSAHVHATEPPLEEDEVEDGIKLDKSNIILMGPTGCGKTLLAQTLAKYLDVPMVICDCTTLTQAGYVGDDIESVIVKLFHEADFNVEKAQQGIIFLDEVDKISCVPGFHHLRDVGGEGVQQGLLKILEGTTVHIPDRTSTKKPKGDTISVDTTNILFIASGAFNSLDKVVAKRKNEKVIGFGAPTFASETSASSSKADDTGLSSTNPDLAEELHRDQLLLDVESRDLMNYGMIPEFVGRFPVLVSLNTLDKDSLVKILTEPKDALVPQYTHLFKLDKVDLTFSKEALYAIADQASSKKTGARGLRSIMEQLLLDSMFDVPNSNIAAVHVDESAVLGKSVVEYKYHPTTEQHKDTQDNLARTGQTGDSMAV